jgi:EAL domain-containing protein (putative c-di-GMP-specific phosphodiesterase class I)/GGDEF domain-containing protein
VSDASATDAPESRARPADAARREFLRDLEREAAAAKESGGRLAILIIELRRVDRLRALLQKPPSADIQSVVLDRLRNALRGDDCMAALSEEQICLVLPRLSHPVQAVLAAVKCLRVLEPPIVCDGEVAELRPCIGIVTVPEHPPEPEHLLMAADIARRKAAQHEENYHVYEAADAERAEAPRGLEADLERALRANGLDVHFQPQVDLRNGRTVGVEALVRWNHPEQGPIPPETVVLTAEACGLIDSLTFWVLNTTLRHGAALAREGIMPRLGVNVSTRVLAGRELPGIVEQALATWDVPPGRVTLEITESAMIVDQERTLALLDRLKGVGVELSIDDFGTGYSSLAYLKRFPVNELKIDQIFVGALLEDPGDRRIVRSVIDLAHNFDLRAVAEGVKDGRALVELRRMGCDIGQGYHISRPMPAADFRQWWRSREALA